MKAEHPKKSLAFQSLFSADEDNEHIPVHPSIISHSFDEISDEQRISTAVSISSQPKVIIDEVSDREDEIEEIKLIHPIPKMQSRYRIGQYVLSMSNQNIYIVKAIVEDLEENTIEMFLHNVNDHEEIEVSMDDLNYQVASADNAIWAVSGGMDTYLAKKLTTPMMLSTKMAIEEFAQKFAKTTTFLNAGNAQSYVFQQIVGMVCEVFQGFQFPEDFLILRSPFAPFDKRFKTDAKTVADILSNQFDMSFTNELLSTNLSLFGNVSLAAESTGLFFAGEGTVGGVSIKLLEELRDSLPFSQDKKEKLFKKMLLVFDTANKLGKEAMALYQIQIPYDLLNTLAYASQPGGRKLNNILGILNSTLLGIKNVGMALNDENMVNFASGQPDMDNQKYFDTLNTYIFKASQFPDFWKGNWLIAPQARVIMNPKYFLNPKQNIKLKVHQSDALQQSSQISMELLEIKLELLTTQIDEKGLLTKKTYQEILDQKDKLPLENVIDMLWEVYYQDSQNISMNRKTLFMENKIREDIDKLKIIAPQKQASLKHLLNSIMIVFDENQYSVLERINRLTNYRNYIYQVACRSQGSLILSILPVRFQEYEKRFLLNEHANFYNVYLQVEIYYQNILKVIKLQDTINQSKNQKKIDEMKKIITDEKISIENVIVYLERLLK